MTISPASILDAFRWRYATKKFDPSRSIPEETWKAIEESLVLTPSSFGLQPWKFLLIEDPVVRERLRAVSWNQSQVTDASRFVVFAARTDLAEEDVASWIGRIAEVQENSVEALAPLKSIISGFIQPMPADARHAWNVRQLYIALGQLMATAAILGIDTCPMEGLDPAAYDEALGLKGTGYATAVACALGYRAADDKAAAYAKVRYDASRIIQRI